MKRKRTNGLSCERARDFPIENALAKLGHFPTRTNDKEAWFLSPFRSEVQASFKVCKRINRWYDHGDGQGGNVIDLVCLITNSSVSEALVILDDEQISFSFQKRPILEGEQNESRIRITQIKELTHIALIDYLKSRGIIVHVANKYLYEVYYSFQGNKYFALGLKNISSGWELRNKYVKNSSSPKDISLIRNGSKKLIVTEGMFDLLSLLT